jgi:hypothetical protein
VTLIEDRVADLLLSCEVRIVGITAWHIGINIVDRVGINIARQRGESIAEVMA